MAALAGPASPKVLRRTRIAALKAAGLNFIVVSELNADRHVNLVGTISGGSDDGLHLFYIDWTQAKAQTGWYLEKTNYSMLSSGS